jgi:hypothetical protein
MANEKCQIPNVKWIVAFAVLLLIAAGFRISVAHWLPNDSPDDGRVYAQMARNVLEQHVYSHDAEPPYNPSLIRLPGYPLFLAAIYAVFGHDNNGAVRVIQALIDTATCVLIALIAFFWQPDEKKKLTSAAAALALAVVCPFTTIYAATILTEVPTNFLLMAMLVAVTLAFRKLTTEGTEEDNKRSFKKALLWWCAAGLIGGLAVMMRPDNGLFLAAVGITLVVSNLWPLVLGLWQRPKAKDPRSKTRIARLIVSGAVLPFAFVLVLAPWTIRNWRIFHLFQPLSPAHAEMPGEFVPHGYLLWVRTWLDDDSYVAPFLWSLDTDEIDVDDLPAGAFDSTEEKNRVAALLDKYNSADESEAPAADEGTETNPNPKATPQPSPEAQKNEEEDKGDESEASEEPPSVEMTPEIDAGFAQLARERIARHPFRYYVWLPLKRARTMWCDTHSQYWPFEGTLLPLDDLDYEHHQQIWLPLFAGLTAVYTLLGLLGAWFLWRTRKLDTRRWLLLVTLAILLRLMLFSFLENPEPRYLVEFFPFLSVLGGLFVGRLLPAELIR